MTELQQGALEHAHEKEVRPWLDLVDELRAHGISQDIPLPQIACVGDQSSGKSSVLEAISGVPFPRGGGLVTRCATQLVMKAAPAGTEWSAKASVTGPRNDYKGCGKVEGGPEALTKVIADLQNALTAGNTSAFSSEVCVCKLHHTIRISRHEYQACLVAASRSLIL
jgi:Dynamin family